LFAVFTASLHRRFLIVFVIAFAPLLAALLARWFSPYDTAKDRPLLNAALMASMIVAFFWMFPSQTELQQHTAKDYPHHAVQYLRDHPVEGPLWNEYVWGGFLIWARYPEHRVFIDGRTDIYEYSGTFSDYIRIARLDTATLALLHKYDIRASLVRRDSALGTLLHAAPGWTSVYRDELSEVFVYDASSPVLKTASPAEFPAGRFTASAALVQQSELRQALFPTVPNR
jgi:hypothetical protein